MNSVIYRPAPACAQHARKKFSYCLILWVVGLVVAFSLTFSQQAKGVNNPFTPSGNNPTIPASLSGVVFYDANQNGQLDNGEYAISGGGIDLYNGDQLVATTTVNSVGQYSFTSLTPGTYTIRNKVDGNWLPVPGIIRNITNSTVASLASGYNWELENVILNAGDQAILFDFAAQNYPIQLLSKRMLLASSGSGQSGAGQPLVQAVPEPATAVMLGFVAIAFIVMAARRRCSKK